MKCLYIPREINQEYVFLWKRDELIFIMLPLLFFIVIGGLIGLSLALVGIIIVSIKIKDFSRNKANGYIFHWLKYNAPEQIVKSVFSAKPKLDIHKSLYFRDKAFPASHVRYIAG